MEKKLSLPRRSRWIVLVATLAVVTFLWSRFGDTGPLLRAQDLSNADRTDFEGVFTPAHDSLGTAARHFLGIRDDPEQPIAFSHMLHVSQVDLQCTFCHDGVSIGPVAGIPSADTCMLCHQEVARDAPEVAKLIQYDDQGIEPPWQRVYGWPEEAHVLFKHRPHFDAGVACRTCHGDVASMSVAERAVSHTMSFCVDCHEQEQASIDCMACHY